MSKHTPGPWEVEPNGRRGAWVAGANGEWAALSCGNDDATARANADLIAAAPDLLAALKRLSHLADTIWVKMSDAEFSAMREAWDQADAAIAKAEGRT